MAGFDENLEVLERIDQTRAEKIKVVARVLILKGYGQIGTNWGWGLQTLLAEYFGVSDSRISRIFIEERKKLEENGAQVTDGPNVGFEELLDLKLQLLELISKQNERHFGRDLYNLRRAFGLDLKAWGQILGIAPGTISNAEMNHSRIQWRPKKAAQIIENARLKDPLVAKRLITLFQKWRYMPKMWEEQYGIKLSDL